MGTYSVVYETFLAVQWLRFCLAKAGGVNSIRGWGTKILHVKQHGRKIKKKKVFFKCGVLHNIAKQLYLKKIKKKKVLCTYEVQHHSATQRNILLTHSGRHLEE